MTVITKRWCFEGPVLEDHNESLGCSKDSTDRQQEEEGAWLVLTRRKEMILTMTKKESSFGVLDRAREARSLDLGGERRRTEESSAPQRSGPRSVDTRSFVLELVHSHSGFEMGRSWMGFEEEAKQSRWEMGRKEEVMMGREDGRREDRRWEMGDGRWETGDGRRKRRRRRRRRRWIGTRR